eukprot:TRINITY_DN105667_c0_g1_i1.p2 TRINITY_DN105667_c0_g1~~TRINITY_DN105667_c0_g1_i1.p2  ORF type:complete len:167 (+),score=19.13 TRINITY_DN105667_c0_g1_i1:68-502(+)
MNTMSMIPKVKKPLEETKKTSRSGIQTPAHKNETEDTSEYKPPQTLELLLDEKLGKPWILDKLVNEGRIGIGDLEVYSNASERLCKGLLKIAGSNKNIKEKVNELKENLKIIKENCAEGNASLLHSMTVTEVSLTYRERGRRKK